MGAVGLLILIILCISPATPYSPTCPLVVGPEVLQAIEGRCAHIPCRYRLCSARHFRPSIKWLRDPVYSRSHGDFRGFLLAAEEPKAEAKGLMPTAPPVGQEGDCSLTLMGVTQRDGGEYGMRIRVNGTGKEPGWKWMHRVTVNVSASPPPPHISPPSPPPLYEGRPVTLTCWTPPPISKCPDEEAPPPLLKWEGAATETEGAQTIPTTPPTTPIPYGGGNGFNGGEWGDDGGGIGVAVSLRFVPTWRLDGTGLRCGRLEPGTGGGGWKEPVWNEWRIRVLYAPRDVWVEVSPPSPIPEGHGVTLTCQASSNPAPHNYAWSFNGAALQRYGAQLDLLPHSDDVGHYSCTATNSQGETQSSPVRVEVIYPPRSAAVIPLTSLPAVEGSRVTLRCRVGPAYPKPIVQWQRLDSPSDALIGPELSFEAVPSRAGTYRCGASNEAGSVQAQPISVVVWYRPRSALIVPLPPPPHVTSVGGAVTLSCRWGAAHPPPTQVTWFRDGRHYPTPPQMTALRLRGPKPEDAGKYECEVKNVAGWIRSAPYQLEVLYPPRSVSIVAVPGPSLSEGAELTLICISDGNPPPLQFDWLKDGRLLRQSAPQRWEMGAVGTAARGRYGCTARNGVGWRSSQPMGISVTLSRGTIIRRTSGGAAGVMAALLLTGALVWHFRCRRRPPSDSDTTPASMGTFFLRPKKPPLLTPPHSEADPICSSSQRAQEDVVVYSVLQQNHGAKVPEGPEYENIENGDPNMDPNTDPSMDPNMDPNGAVLYAALALPPPTLWGRSGASNGDGVEYEELRG